jgi:ParB-like chromosome segregation protein Spo0J
MAKAPKKRAWPAAKVEMVRVDAITPYARNARKHPPAQIATLKKLIQQYGFTTPLLLDEKGGLIAGEGRLLAAKSLGLEEVPSMRAIGWTEAEKKAYVIADNKVSLSSVWDEDMLVMELGDLNEDGFDLELTGFGEKELEQLLSPPTTAESEWQGMPEFAQANKQAFRTIAVHFNDPEAVNTFAELIKQTLTDKTKFVWFPQAEIETYADKRYESES